MSLGQTRPTELHLFEEDKKKQIQRHVEIREESSLGNVNEQIFSYPFKKQLLS